MPINTAASIRQRLLNKAKKDARPFHELLQYYAMERFLYRLSCSQHAASFILKGALILHAWQAPDARSTMDIDFLGKDSNQEEKVFEQMLDILSVDCAQDGLIFDRNLKMERITEDADYQGIRVQSLVFLDSAKISLQIDIGFGDIIFPRPEKLSLPTLLDLQAPYLWCYSRESVIAEKLEAMIKLGELNSRMKDFYDIWYLARNFSFNGETLKKAIELIFNKRENQPSSDGVFLSSAFVEKKQVQWAAFRRRLGQEYFPEKFEEVASFLRVFLIPILQALEGKNDFYKHWPPSDRWQDIVGHRRD